MYIVDRIYTGRKDIGATRSSWITTHTHTRTGILTFNT